MRYSHSENESSRLVNQQPNNMQKPSVECNKLQAKNHRLQQIMEMVIHKGYAQFNDDNFYLWKISLAGYFWPKLFLLTIQKS